MTCFTGFRCRGVSDLEQAVCGVPGPDLPGRAVHPVPRSLPSGRKHTAGSAHQLFVPGSALSEYHTINCQSPTRGSFFKNAFQFL